MICICMSDAAVVVIGRIQSFTQDQFVVFHIESVNRRPCEIFNRRSTCNDPFLEIDRLGDRFVIFEACPVLSSDRLFGQAEVEMSACCAGEERRVLQSPDG